MNPEYTWLTVGKCPSKNYIDIMAAPITEPSLFLEEIQKILSFSGITLCIGGELKTSESLKPASNFRYEKDEDLNKNVIENYLQMFNFTKKFTIVYLCNNNPKKLENLFLVDYGRW